MATSLALLAIVILTGVNIAETRPLAFSKENLEVKYAASKGLY